MRTLIIGILFAAAAATTAMAFVPDKQEVYGRTLCATYPWLPGCVEHALKIQDYRGTWHRVTE